VSDEMHSVMLQLEIDTEYSCT